MSFILDALRKSESERQREAPPSLIRTPLATIRRETPVWTWFLIGLLSSALVALAAVGWLRDRSEPAVAATAIDPSAPLTTAVDPALSPAPAAAPPGASPSPAGPRPIEDLQRVDPNLPDYVLSFLEYNVGDPGRRSAWINGRRYVPGQRLDSGPELVSIQADGVVLAHRGETYLLTAR